MDRLELIRKLDEVAEMTPPICHLDKPEMVNIMGKEITVYCKPFEEFQSLVKQAAAALRKQEQLARNLQQRANNEQVTESLRPNGFSGSENELATKNQVKLAWISVKERLPEPFCGVLVCCPRRNNVYEVYLNARGEWHFFDTSVAGAVLRDEVTHWMSLPEPPEGGAE